MAVAPQYVGTPKTWVGQVTTANTNRDGTGTIATIATAGASGSRIDTVTIKAIATTTAGTVRLFLNDGTNTRLLDEIPVIAVTPSATIPAWEAVLGGNAPVNTGKYPLFLPAGWSLRASTQNAETFNIFPAGGDF
jgi:phospholipase/lecithinase/hemolysin